VPFELAANRGMMSREEISPCVVAHGGQALGRTHDVCEENRRQHAIGLAGSRLSGHELFDLAHHGPAVV
jgi:hypothetical protein